MRWVVHFIYTLYHGRAHEIYHKGRGPTTVQPLFNVSWAHEDRRTVLDSVHHSCSFAQVLSLLLGLLLPTLLRVTSTSSSNSPCLFTLALALFTSLADI